MYDKVSTNLNFVDREKEILGFWKQNDIFGESIKARENCPVSLSMMDLLQQTVSHILVIF